MTEAALERALGGAEPEHEELAEMMRYSLLGGGKRIRPVLLFEFYRLCGGCPEDAAGLASAIEMIHTYSLIHDDLPCMDNDSLRRGKPCSHIVYGEAAALLAGDALLTLAFETALRPGKGISAERTLDAARELAFGAGMRGMCGGQALDIKQEADRSGIGEAETVRLIHRMKTGALFEAACKCGCLLAGAGDEAVAMAAEYAGAFGLAFQIRDDVLDVEGEAGTLGKNTGKDQDKLTFVKLYGLDGCKREIEALTKKATGSLSRFEDSGFLYRLAETLSERIN